MPKKTLWDQNKKVIAIGGGAIWMGPSRGVNKRTKRKNRRGKGRTNRWVKLKKTFSPRLKKKEWDTWNF